MMKKLKIGLIGAGSIARTHLKAYSRLDNAEVVAVCDINPANLKKTCDRFGIPEEHRYNSVEAMLAAEKELDAADVCVWNINHAPCAIAALRAGLHVLCEKPMAYNTAQAEEMKAEAEKAGKLLMVGFVLRFSPENDLVKSFVDSGVLGDIYYSKATYLRRHGNPGGWFANKSLSGGGPVIDLGVHVIDQTRFLMGSPKPVSVYAMTSDKMTGRKLKADIEWRAAATGDDVCDVEDFGVALIRYENGATTLLETSYELNGPDNTSKALFGTKGGVTIDSKSTRVYTDLNGYIADVAPQLPSGSFDDIFANEMAHFVDCALNGTPCRATAEDGITVMKILDAIYESARTGHEVVLK